MAFLGYDDILLLGKNDGRVLRIVNHTVLANTLLDVGVANKWERGLLGIAILKDAGSVYVFLYYTESNGGDGRRASVQRFIACHQQLIHPITNFTGTN